MPEFNDPEADGHFPTIRRPAIVNRSVSTGVRRFGYIAHLAGMARLSGTR